MIHQTDTKQVTLIDIVIDTSDREAFFRWATDNPVYLKRTGPAPIENSRGRFHADRLLMVGYIEGQKTESEIIAGLIAAGVKP